jgi:hypothetical protein
MDSNDQRPIRPGKAGVCPRCSGTNVRDLGSHTRAPNQLALEQECKDCGLEFLEVYETVSYLIGQEVDGQLHQSGDHVAAQGAREVALELLVQLETLVEYLQEAHQDEIDDDHGGDDPGTCSYCRAIEAARELTGPIRAATELGQEPGN